MGRAKGSLRGVATDPFAAAVGSRRGVSADAAEHLRVLDELQENSDGALAGLLGDDTEIAQAAAKAYAAHCQTKTGMNSRRNIWALLPAVNKSARDIIEEALIPHLATDFPDGEDWECVRMLVAYEAAGYNAGDELTDASLTYLYDHYKRGAQTLGRGLFHAFNQFGLLAPDSHVRERMFANPDYVAALRGGLPDDPTAENLFLWQATVPWDSSPDFKFEELQTLQIMDEHDDPDVRDLAQQLGVRVADATRQTIEQFDSMKDDYVRLTAAWANEPTSSLQEAAVALADQVRQHPNLQTATRFWTAARNDRKDHDESMTGLEAAALERIAALAETGDYTSLLATLTAVERQRPDAHKLASITAVTHASALTGQLQTLPARLRPDAKPLLQPLAAAYLDGFQTTGSFTNDTAEEKVRQQLADATAAYVTTDVDWTDLLGAERFSKARKSVCGRWGSLSENINAADVHAAVTAGYATLTFGPNRSGEFSTEAAFRSLLTIDHPRSSR